MSGMINEHYYTQVNETIKSLFDLTARIDERVQIMMKKQDELDVKLDALIMQNHDLAARVRILESQDFEETYDILDEKLEDIKSDIMNLQLRIGIVEDTANTQEKKWSSVFGTVFQFLGAVFTAYVIYKLGLDLP